MCKTCFNRGYNDYPEYLSSNIEHKVDYIEGYKTKQNEILQAEEQENTFYCKKCFENGVRNANIGIWAPPMTTKLGHYDSYEKGYYQANEPENTEMNEQENNTIITQIAETSFEPISKSNSDGINSKYSKKQKVFAILTAVVCLFIIVSIVATKLPAGSKLVKFFTYKKTDTAEAVVKLNKETAGVVADSIKKPVLIASNVRDNNETHKSVENNNKPIVSQQEGHANIDTKSMPVMPPQAARQANKKPGEIAMNQNTIATTKPKEQSAKPKDDIKTVPAKITQVPLNQVAKPSDKNKEIYLSKYRQQIEKQKISAVGNKKEHTPKSAISSKQKTENIEPAKEIVPAKKNTSPCKRTNNNEPEHKKPKMASYKPHLAKQGDESKKIKVITRENETGKPFVRTKFRMVEDKRPFGAKNNDQLSKSGEEKMPVIKVETKEKESSSILKAHETLPVKNAKNVPKLKTERYYIFRLEDKNTDEHNKEPYGGRFVFASKRILNENDLAKKKKDELTIMLNEIYARHDFIFKDDSLRHYFSEKYWYIGDTPDVTSLLTDIEKYNIEFIKNHLK